MNTCTLPDDLMIALRAAAARNGQTLDEFVAHACVEALSLEIDRTRVAEHLAGRPAISHERAREWLRALAAGNRKECPR